jgi:inosine triphosphate pyrophosphatase
MEKLCFVSSNLNKFKEVEAILADFVKVEHVELDLLEPQTDQVSLIARYKAQQAAERLGCPVIVEDSCLGFDAWNGLPGPFVKYFLQKLSPEGKQINY